MSDVIFVYASWRSVAADGGAVFVDPVDEELLLLLLLLEDVVPPPPVDADELL